MTSAEVAALWQGVGRSLGSRSPPSELFRPSQEVTDRLYSLARMVIMVRVRRAVDRRSWGSFVQELQRVVLGLHRSPSGHTAPPMEWTHACGVGEWVRRRWDASQRELAGVLSVSASMAMNRRSLDCEAERAGQDIPSFVSRAQPLPDIRVRIGPGPEPEAVRTGSPSPPPPLSPPGQGNPAPTQFMARIVFVDGDEEVRLQDLLAIRQAYFALVDRHSRLGRRHARLRQSALRWAPRRDRAFP
jgi:hypothetical protein